jgi:hypothetical protein
MQVKRSQLNLKLFFFAEIHHETIMAYNDNDSLLPRFSIFLTATDIDDAIELRRLLLIGAGSGAQGLRVFQ